MRGGGTAAPSACRTVRRCTRWRRASPRAVPPPVTSPASPPGYAASAIGDNVYLERFDPVELRIHTTDASGTSREGIYDTVGVGDSLDYRMRDFDCGIRLRVTSVGPAASSRTFGVEYVAEHGRQCAGFYALPREAGAVDLEWGVRPGVPGPDGVRVMLPFEPAGEGTYRVHGEHPWVIDVPTGIRVSGGVHERIHLSPAPFRSPGPGFVYHVSSLPLEDVETGATLTIHPLGGVEAARYDATPVVDALFDQIAASIRYREVPPDDPGPAFASASGWTWTVTRDGERDPLWSGAGASKEWATTQIAWYLLQLLDSGEAGTYTVSPCPTCGENSTVTHHR